MTSQQKLNFKLRIIQEFKGVSFTLVEVFEILDDLKNEFSRIAVENELKKLKFKGVKK